MAILVKLSTTLRDYVPEYIPADGLTLHVALPATAQDVAEQLGLPLGEIKIVMRNGRHAALNDSLEDDDRLAFFPAVGGG